jgi:xanthine dehydrogenase iron-sulfur cluster and FAD-binding subunit A
MSDQPLTTPGSGPIVTALQAGMERNNVYAVARAAAMSELDELYQALKTVQERVRGLEAIVRGTSQVLGLELPAEYDAVARVREHIADLRARSWRPPHHGKPGQGGR